MGGCNACTVCGAGKKMVAEPKVTIDRKCEQCEEWHYTTDVNEETCTEQPTCGGGKHGEYITSVSQDEKGECKLCAKNTYQNKTLEVPHRELSCIPCASNQITYETGSIGNDTCKNVDLSIKSSSHRLWLSFNVETDQLECAAVSIQIVDKLNGGATSMITPDPLPANCTSLSRSQFASKLVPPVLPERLNFLGGKDPFVNYPLKMDASSQADGATQIVVHPGQTFQIAIHVIKDQLELPYALSVTTPCGCSEPTNFLAVDTSVARTLRVSGACAEQSALNTNFLLHAEVTADNRPIYQSEDGTIYLHFDKDCSGEGHPARWLFDTAKPSTTASSDLDEDGTCNYRGRIDSTGLLPPTGTAEWRLSCAGEWTDVTLSLADNKDDSISCDRTGLDYIEAESECERAASILGLVDTDADVVTYDDDFPYGCYYMSQEDFPDANNTARLTLNLPGKNADGKKGVGKDKYHSICGTTYCVEGDDGEKLDCASEPEVTGNTEYLLDEQSTQAIQWLDGGDKTGKPGQFSADQSFGLVHFKWTDRSLCEQAYSLSREVTGERVKSRGTETFVEDTYFAGKTECGEKVSIASVFDNLLFDAADKAEPGENRKYCLRAVSNHGVGVQGYASAPVCKDVVVAWEASIKGRVLSRRGDVPVAGVRVTWRIEDADGNVIQEAPSQYIEEKDSNGTITGIGKRFYDEVASDADGRFLLRVLDRAATHDTPQARTVHLDYWKESSGGNGTFHEFWCPGEELCGGIGVDSGSARQKYVMVDDSASCSKNGLSYVDTDAECESAASAYHLGLKDTRVDAVDVSEVGKSPYGCIYQPDMRLSLNVGSNAEKGTRRAKFHSICRNDTYAKHAHTVEHKVVATHLTFDTPATITDATTIPFGGKVYFPREVKVLSRDETAALRQLPAQTNPGWPEGWGAGNQADKQCPLRNAEVCLHAYSQFAEKIACTTSGEGGIFTLAALPHVPFVVRVTLGSHKHFVRTENTDNPSRATAVRMKPALAPGVDECDDCMEVFTLIAGDETFGTGMNYEDRTTRLLDVDVHGTLCKHPIGNAAYMKFEVPGGVCGHMPALLPTAYQTNSLVILPAHLFDVTLEAVEPPYEEATASTQFGYFHRLRTRTQRVDVFDEASQRDPEIDDQDNAGRGEMINHHAVTYQYHPAPAINIAFFKNREVEGETLLEPLVPTLCEKASAVDASISESIPLGADQNHQAPGWEMRTGMSFAAEARPVATIKFPYPREKHPTCDWIVGKIAHESYVGFSRSDRHFFSVDPASKSLVPKDTETTEYKEFANILNKTLPPQVTLEDLARCSNPEEPGCLVDTVHSTAVSLRTDFSDDSTCTSPQQAGNLSLQFGYTIFNSNAQLCVDHWAKQASKRRTRFHTWHLLDWNQDLTVAQQKAWNSAGVTADLYRRGQETRTWQYFSRVVLAPAKSWASLEHLDPSIIAALTRDLHFTPDTWGRAWAFTDRIFLNDVTVLPDWNEHLTAKERAALGVLGFHEGNWAEPDPHKGYSNTSNVYESPKKGNFKIRDWDNLLGPNEMHHNQQGNLSNVLKVTRWHWMRAKTAAAHGELVQGCYWDHGRGEAATNAWISRVNTPDDSGGDRQRRQVGSAQIVLRMCPAGEQSADNGSDCVACPPGTFKSSSMSLNKICQQKMKDCSKANADDNPYLHVGKSKVVDDNVCIPSGQCALGFEKTTTSQKNCSRCPEGQFKDRVSDRRCVAKQTDSCKSGQYTTVGNESAVDDTLCISCPFATYSTAGNVSQCTPKSMLTECAPGTYLKISNSATENDITCAACPTGTWKSDSTPTPIASCRAKLLTACPAGEYLFAGPSDERDDNACIVCPVGTFSPTAANSKSCRAKHMVPCQANQTLHHGESQKEDDNVCVSTGFCPAGYHRNATIDEDEADADTYCIRCSAGTFSPRVSNRTYTECDRKRVTKCPIGTHVFHGDSVTSDDSRCSDCPSGTYKSQNQTACFLKRALPTNCTAGKHVSRGLSRTFDDHKCQDCPQGTFQPEDDSNANFCRLKARPSGGCPAGQFLSLGKSTKRDDFECKKCATGTFKTQYAPSDATGCSAKVTEKQCEEDEILVSYNVATRNDVCTVPAQCGIGERVGNDKLTCEQCPDGEYNPHSSVQTECTTKTDLKSCPPGTFYYKGNAATRDDWQCTECPPGTYSEEESTESSVCNPKSLPESNCGHGEDMYWGRSKTENDWFCVPAARFTALCAKSYDFGARSVMQGLAAGMPIQVLPFTTRYVAKMIVVGYPAVHAEEVIVITGSRYVSDAEKLPFPEGRPILALHDPPGGASFSSFINTRATTSVSIYDYTGTRAKEMDFQSKIGVGAESMIPIVGTKILDFALGAAADAHYTSSTSDHTVDRKETAGDTFTFTYQTSASPERAGPASDAFLMPALTFEVIEVWIVKFAGTADPTDCKIRGFSDKSLKARNDLSAFYFITANDVETRTLPLLLHVSDDVRSRLDCDETKACCTKEEEEVFCKASDLAEYCHWKYGDTVDATGGEARCNSIVDDHWKTKCKVAANQARLQAQARNKADAFWTECTRSQPVCPNQEGASDKRTFRQVGNKVLCEPTVVEDPDYAELEGVAQNVDKSTLRAQAEAAYAGALRCTGNSCSAVSSFKIKCAPVPTALGPLGKCSKDGHSASSVEEYCSKKHKGDGAEAELACTTFTPTDQYSKAHDNWYNSLSRNYAKQEKAIVGPEATVAYTILDSLKGPEPAPTSEVVHLEPMASLAPTMLIQNAMTQAGNSQSDAKKASFEAYNTLSFEGGGSSISYSWETGSTANGNDFEGHVTESTIETANGVDEGGHGGLFFENENPGFYITGEVKGGATSKVLTIATTLETSSDEAQSAFTLSDQDAGDYFLVTVWNDPEYPTPIFAVRGGASSCKWEYNTYHRVAPAMAMVYVGPQLVPPTAPALFKLRLQNAAQYYESGPSAGKSRPGWTTVDQGYFLPALTLAVRPETIKYGLTLRINGRAFTADMTFPQFGKGAVEVLVEASAGPVGQEPSTSNSFRTYPSPVFAFSQECKGKHAIRDIGERAVDVALQMTGTITAPVLRFLQPCPSVEWAGEIKTASTFVIDAGDANAFGFYVSNPSGRNWKLTSSFVDLIFQFRYDSYIQSGIHASSDWESDPNVVFDLDSSEGEAFVKGRWGGPDKDFPDGVYSIRVISSCKANAAAVVDTYAQSSTATIKGVVDRKPPAMLSAIAPLGSTVLLPGMLVAATFNENVVCSGMTNNGKPIQPELIITASASGVGAKEVSFSVGRNHLDYICDGPVISVALTSDGVAVFNQNFPDLSVLAGTTAQLTLESGVTDSAGNIATGKLLFFLPVGGDNGTPTTSGATPGTTTISPVEKENDVGDDEDSNNGSDKPATSDATPSTTTPPVTTPGTTTSPVTTPGTTTSPVTVGNGNEVGDGEDSNNSSDKPATSDATQDTATSQVTVGNGNEVGGDEDSKNEVPSGSNETLQDEASSNSQASAGGDGGGSAVTSSYVSMALVIIALVGIFLYIRQEFSAISAKLDRVHLESNSVDEVKNHTVINESSFPSTFHASTLTRNQSPHGRPSKLITVDTSLFESAASSPRLSPTYINPSGFDAVKNPLVKGVTRAAAPLNAQAESQSKEESFNGFEEVKTQHTPHVPAVQSEQFDGFEDADHDSNTNDANGPRRGMVTLTANPTLDFENDGMDL